jgi:hypothetical protein
MAEHPSRSEADLASERNANLQRDLESKRLASILLSGLFFTGAALVGLLGFAVASFCLVVVALIFLLRYFDANGHLHEVRRRSKKSLVPPLSALEREGRSASSSQGQPLAQG